MSLPEAHSQHGDEASGSAVSPSEVKDESPTQSDLVEPEITPSDVIPPTDTESRTVEEDRDGKGDRPLKDHVNIELRDNNTEDAALRGPPESTNVVGLSPGQSAPSKASNASDNELAAQLQTIKLGDPFDLVPKEEKKEGDSKPPPPPPKDEKYLDREGSSANKSLAISASHKEAKVDKGDSASEIQSIMEQFDEGMGGVGEQEIMSPRLEVAGSALEHPAVHPPRRSSLDPLARPIASQLETQASSSIESSEITSPPPRTSSLPFETDPGPAQESPISERPSSVRSPSSVFKPPPLEPDPEPDQPFDFHRFLEQLRHKTADPVARYLRSFLVEFGRKQWMVHEQVKIIGDFLEFISNKMLQCEVWRKTSDTEFDNAREGMEKLVMNRLYTQTFSPAIPPPETNSSKGKKAASQPISGSRRGQHQEDVERDDVLGQKVSIYGWVREPHLDIKPLDEKGRKFLRLAQQELLKIKSYRAPRDKIICVLNCCKVIFGFLRNAKSDQSADAFVPLLIYTVLRANPEHLVSNVQYILRFRNQDKLGGETGYYLSSLMGAVQFIENLDRTSLTISDEEFEKNVEAAVSSIAEKHTQSERVKFDKSASDEKGSQPSQSKSTLSPSQAQEQLHLRHPPNQAGFNIPEKSTISRPEITPRNSIEAEGLSPRRRRSQGRSSRSADASADEEENPAVANLLRTIQRPLSTIGRIFSDDGGSSSNQSSAQQSSSSPSRKPRTPPAQTLRPGGPALTPRLSPEKPQQPPRAPSSPRRSNDGSLPSNATAREDQGASDGPQISAEEAAARQASAEAEEARKVQRQEHRVVVDTLAGMFPELDREVIDDVVRVKEGRVGLAVDACLALSS